jgi:hypothetical protein
MQSPFSSTTLLYGGISDHAHEVTTYYLEMREPAWLHASSSQPDNIELKQATIPCPELNRIYLRRRRVRGPVRNAPCTEAHKPCKPFVAGQN